MKSIQFLPAAFFFSVCMLSCDDGDYIQPPPSVDDASIVNDGINVPRNQDVTFRFNRNMDAKTINESSFTLHKGTTRVAGDVSYADKTARFNPTSELEPDQEYIATLSAEIKDQDGRSIEETSIKFKTAGTKKIIARVLLREASDFVAFAKTTIINNPNSSIKGDMGISPSNKEYIAGFSLIDRDGYASSTQVDGRVYAHEMTNNTSIYLMNVANSLTLAYEDAQSRTDPDFLNLSDGTLTSGVLIQGVYKWNNAVKITENITLSGGEDDVWIFQIDGDLTVQPDVTITLLNGASAENIFWQVKGNTTIGTNAHVEGTILAKGGIEFRDGASLEGRALAQTGITLSGNKIAKPVKL